MQYIPLSKNKFALVDDEDFDRLRGIQWSFDGRYATRHIGRKKIYLHKQILKTKDPFVIDHINGDKLDCRQSNLRIVSQIQNGFNRTELNKNNTSKVRGVSWNAGRKGWDAYLKVNYKKKYLGRFKDKHVAALARKWGERLYT